MSTQYLLEAKTSHQMEVHFFLEGKIPGKNGEGKVPLEKFLTEGTLKFLTVKKVSSLDLA